MSKPAHTDKKAETSEFRNNTHDSVPEREISRSNLVHEQIQGTETPAHFHNYIPAEIPLKFPCEIIERILLLLDSGSILKCKLINKGFNNLIQTSTLLQYFLACKVAGVIDNPRSTLSYGERLDALKRREDAWRTLKPVFEKTIKVDQQLHRTHCLTQGTYFLDDNNQKDLHYCHLPSSPQENLQWKRVSCHGPGEDQPGIFIDFAGAIHEHDLVINLISTEVGNHLSTQQRYSLDLVLLKFSTGEYHPLARHPRIHLKKSLEVGPVLVLDVAGDNLALIIDNGDMDPNSLSIFDWKTGHKRLQHETTENSYSDLVFISPELLLVPNLILSLFEVWYIPPSNPNPTPPVQILALKMPLLSPDYSIQGTLCRGEPSPYLHSLPYFPPRPFFPSPEDSIIIANFHFLSELGYINPSYAFIMHRGALLNTISKRLSFSLLEQSGNQPIWSMNEATVNQMTDSNDGSVRLDARSKSISIMPHQRSYPLPYGVPAFAPFQGSMSYLSTDPGSLAISSRLPITLFTSRYDYIQVEWADWGPPISRWFQLNNDRDHWLMSSNGQRFAFSTPNPQDGQKMMVNVANFNQYNVRRNATMMAAQRQRDSENKSSSGNMINSKEEEEPERFDHGGVFDEEVYMGLKCVIYQALDEHDFDGVLMDAERLLGVKSSDDGRPESVQVLYFG